MVFVCGFILPSFISSCYLDTGASPNLRIVLIQNYDFGLWHFHRSLIKALQAAGAEVWAITPPGACVAAIEGLGVQHRALPMARFVSPWQDLVLFFRLTSLLREIRPDIAQTITIKPNTIGILAASIAGVPHIVSQVPGLGYVFGVDRSLRSRITRAIVDTLYRLAFARAEKVWFLNPDDLREFEAERLITSGKGVVIRSSGVSLTDYMPADRNSAGVAALRDELGIPAGTKIVLMAARMTWSKGVREFVEAANRTGQSRSDIIFLLAGGIDDPHCPDPVPAEYLRMSESRHFRWLGFRDDMPRLFQLADIVTLPSLYREGIPRTLLEALATGRPIVTTDTAGCRETVDAGRNGFYVPPGDPEALACAIERLLADSSLREKMGRESRIMAADFAEEKVMEAVLRELYPALAVGRSDHSSFTAGR